MARILLIETSTAQLTTALAEDGVIRSFRCSEEPRRQASLTAPFVRDVLEETGWKIKELDAVCVGKGPGSYTGLRVGVSTAKGLCFGAGLPLLSAGTLDILVKEARRLDLLPQGCRHIVPMVDARRMEVYSAVFTPEGEQLSGTRPVIVEEDSFAEVLSQGPVLFVGDGALKCRDILSSPNAFFAAAYPTAMAMAPLAEEAYAQKRFEDVAYFEPFYLKDFVATVSRKKLF